MKNILSILLLAMMTCCWSCSGGGEDVPTPTPTPTPKPEEKPKIELTTAAPVAPQEGGSATVTFTSTEAWTIDVTEGRAVSWCSVTPTSGSKGNNTLTVKTTANDTYDERNAKVTIKAGATTQSFVVTQKQKDGLTVTSNKVEVSAEGGDIAIEVKANVKFEYQIEEAAQSWITSDGSRTLTASTLKFKVAENDKTSKREAKITIHSGELKETVTIYQEGSKPTLVLTLNEYTVASEGETIKVELKSNVDYEVQLPDVDWVKESSSRAMSAATHYFEVAPNGEYDARKAEILFVNKENGISEKVMINQAQKDAIIVAKNEYTIEAAGGSLDFEVNTNVDFKVETSVDWIKQNTKSRGLEAKPLSFKIAENTANEAREGLITITSGDLKQEIKVLQKAKNSLSVSQTEFNVPSDGGKISFTVTSNVEYDVNWNSVDWLKNTSKTDGKYVFTVAVNEGYDARNVDITVLNKETKEKTIVKVLQAQKDAIIVAKNEYTIEAAGGSLDFEVNTNVDFKVETSVDWIKQNTGSRGLEANPLSFKIAENTADEAREGLITITSGDLKQEIKVVQKAKTSLSVSQTEFNVPSDGGKISFTVTSNVKYDVNWTSVSWLKNTSKDNGKYVFTVAANGGYDARNVDITVLNKETQEKTIVKVLQAQKDAIIVAKNEYTIDATGGDLKFDVKTNIDFKIETSVDWIKQNTGSRGLEAKPLSFTVAENTAEEAREGLIIVSSGNLKQEIKVIQKAKTIFVVSQTEFNVPSDGGEISFTVTSNVKYEVNCNPATWIKNTSKDNGKYVFTVAANERYNARNVGITVLNKETQEKTIVKVLQAQKDAIIVGKNEYTIEAAGGNLDFEVNTNVEFKVETSVDWIKQNTESRGLEMKSLSFTIAPNTAVESREGVITLSSGDLKQEIKVIQKAKFTISVSETDFNVGVEGGEISFVVSHNGLFYNSKPNVKWLEILEPTQTTPTTRHYTIKVEPNETPDVRETEIVCTHNKSGEQVKVKITQAANECIIEPEKYEYTVDYKVSLLTIKVNSNAKYEVKSNLDWIEYRKFTSTPDAIKLDIKENKGKKREGKIILSYKETSKEITIKQEGFATGGGGIDDIPEHIL